MTLPEPDSSPFAPMVSDDMSHALLVDSTLNGRVFDCSSFTWAS